MGRHHPSHKVAAGLGWSEGKARSAAVALAIGAFGPLGAPLGLVGLLTALLVVHVAVETALHQAAGEGPPDVAAATGPSLP